MWRKNLRREKLRGCSFKYYRQGERKNGVDSLRGMWKADFQPGAGMFQLRGSNPESRRNRANSAARHRGGLRLALSVPVRVRHERAGADALGGQAWGNRRFYPEAAGTGDRRPGRICRSCFGRRRAGRKIRADSGIGRGRECRISNYKNKFRRLISSRKIRRNVQRDGKPDFCAQKNQDSVSEILAEGKATSSGFAALSHLPQRGRQSFVSEILEMRLIRTWPEPASPV